MARVAYKGDYFSCVGTARYWCFLPGTFGTGFLSGQTVRCNGNLFSNTPSLSSTWDGETQECYCTHLYGCLPSINSIVNGTTKVTKQDAVTIKVLTGTPHKSVVQVYTGHSNIAKPVQSFNIRSNYTFIVCGLETVNIFETRQLSVVLRSRLGSFGLATSSWKWYNADFTPSDVFCDKAPFLADIQGGGPTTNTAVYISATGTLTFFQNNAYSLKKFVISFETKGNVKTYRELYVAITDNTDQWETYPAGLQKVQVVNIGSNAKFRLPKFAVNANCDSPPKNIFGATGITLKQDAINGEYIVEPNDPLLHTSYLFQTSYASKTAVVCGYFDSQQLKLIVGCPDYILSMDGNQGISTTIDVLLASTPGVVFTYKLPAIIDPEPSFGRTYCGLTTTLENLSEPGIVYFDASCVQPCTEVKLLSTSTVATYTFNIVASLPSNIKVSHSVTITVSCNQMTISDNSNFAATQTITYLLGQNPSGIYNFPDPIVSPIECAVTENTIIGSTDVTFDTAQLQPRKVVDTPDTSTIKTITFKVQSSVMGVKFHLSPLITINFNCNAATYILKQPDFDNLKLQTLNVPVTNPIYTFPGYTIQPTLCAIQNIVPFDLLVNNAATSVVFLTPASAQPSFQFNIDDPTWPKTINFKLRTTFLDGTVLETPDIQMELTCGSATLTPSPSFTPESRFFNFVINSDSTSIYTFPAYVVDPPNCFTRLTEIVETAVEGVADSTAIVFSPNCTNPCLNIGLASSAAPNKKVSFKIKSIIPYSRFVISDIIEITIICIDTSTKINTGINNSSIEMPQHAQAPNNVFTFTPFTCTQPSCCLADKGLTYKITNEMSTTPAVFNSQGFEDQVVLQNGLLSVTVKPNLQIQNYTFFVYAENGWGTKAISQQVTVSITCDAQSTILTEASYPAGFSDYQIVQSESELKSVFVLPSVDSLDPKCPHQSVKIVETASLNAPQSTKFATPTGIESVKPSNLTLETEYTFYIVFIAKGGAQTLSTKKTLIVGCTPSQNYTQAQDFKLQSSFVSETPPNSIYTIIPPTSDRLFCPVVAHEVFNTTVNSVITPNQLVLSADCAKGLVCDKLDITPIFVTALIKFKIKSYFSKTRNDVFFISDQVQLQVTVRLRCFLSKNSKSPFIFDQGKGVQTILQESMLKELIAVSDKDCPLIYSITAASPEFVINGFEVTIDTVKSGDYSFKVVGKTSDWKGDYQEEVIFGIKVLEPPPPPPEPEPEPVEEKAITNQQAVTEDKPPPPPSAKEQIQASINQGDKIETLGAAAADWQAKADPEMIARLWKQLEEKSKDEIPSLEAFLDRTPVSLWIDEITRNGTVIIKFNQVLKVPGFITSENKDIVKGRNMVSLSELDVARDIMDFTFIMRSDLEASDIQFFLEVQEWNTEQLKIYMNFTNPTIVSTGLTNDQIICRVKNRLLFVSNQTGQPLEEDKIELVKSIPRQLPKEVDEESLKNSAVGAGAAMQSFMVIQLVAQFFLKGLMQNLWSLFFTLQLICYMKIYTFSVPSNTEMIVKEVTKIIEFEILNPQGIVRLFYPKFKLTDLLFKEDENSLKPDYARSLLEYMQIYIVFVCLFAIVLVLLLILALIRKIREKIMIKLDAVKKKMLFNGIIRSFQIASMSLIMGIGVQIKLKVTNSIYQTTAQFLQAISFLAALMIFLVVIIVFLGKNKHLMNTLEFKSKYENLYQDIHLTRSKTNIYFFPIFILRRIFFVMVPSFLNFYPWAQIQFAIVVQMVYVIYYQNTRPHKLNSRVRLEIFNEVIVTICFYHNFLFTDFLVDNESFKFIMGYSFIGILLLCVFVNITSLSGKLVDTVQLHQRIKQAKKLRKDDQEFFKKRMEELTSNQWQQLSLQQRYQIQQKRKIDEPDALDIKKVPEHLAAKMTKLAEKQVKKELKQIQEKRLQEGLKIIKTDVNKKIQQLRSLVKSRNQALKMTTIKEQVQEEDLGQEQYIKSLIYHSTLEIQTASPILIKAKQSNQKPKKAKKQIKLQIQEEEEEPEQRPVIQLVPLSTPVKKDPVVVPVREQLFVADQEAQQVIEFVELSTPKNIEQPSTPEAKKVDRQTYYDKVKRKYLK